jgi:hypothetical protein
LYQPPVPEQVKQENKATVDQIKEERKAEVDNRNLILNQNSVHVPDELKEPLPVDPLGSLASKFPMLPNSFGPDPALPHSGGPVSFDGKDLIVAAPMYIQLRDPKEVVVPDAIPKKKNLASFY